MTPLNSSGRHSALRRLAGASIIAAATLVALPASAQTATPTKPAAGAPETG